MIAAIDTGTNPYNVAFRDDSPLGYTPPWLYIPGYPVNTPALRLHLNETDYATAFAKDKGTWLNVTRGQLYWIPGTKIVGGISFANGGTDCPRFTTIPPLSGVDPLLCTDYKILDDAGHGSMTSSRMAGNPHSLCPECRIVEIEGLGAKGVKWAADQGWIDVQTDSWLSLIPAPAEGTSGNASTGYAFGYAASLMPTFAASGNGAAFAEGFAPTPTYALSTAAPGVILVGAHDNGKMALWSGAPPVVVADGYGGYRANRTSTTDFSPDPISCCTSAASPYAAGGGAAIILHARQVLGDAGEGWHAHNGVLAQGLAGLVPSGPLADGVFTLDEFKEIIRETAQARPTEGKDDGLTQWMGHPQDGLPTGYVVKWGPGANPFCQGCTTAPVDWSAIPDAVDAAYPLIGYGAINEFSVAHADAVLDGSAPMPARPYEDAMFSTDQTVRALFHPEMNPAVP